MKYLPPMIMREAYWKSLEKEIIELLTEYIYRPLMKLAADEIRNAVNPLIDAIQHGDVWYSNGVFYGTFNAKITRELRLLGAKYRHGEWHLPLSKMPSQVSLAISYSRNRQDKIRKNVDGFLKEFNPDYIKLDPTTYQKTIDKMDKNFALTMTGLDDLGIKAKTTPEMKKIIAEQWTNNLNLYIKDWAQETIVDLRDRLQPAILGGGRAKSLEAHISESYGVSRAKAKFLARQETGLLMAKYTKNRYKDAGIQKYRWGGANDSRERPDHKKLNGKIFMFDSPPVTDHRTGARNNPGEDFGCRCTAIPIIE